MSLRAVRSPLAPKMTMEQGSTALRSASNRQAMSSSRCSGVFTGETLAEVWMDFNVISKARARALGREAREGKTLFASRLRQPYFTRTAADVAELADAPDSKSGTRESVWVRPPPSAPPRILDRKSTRLNSS